MTILAGVLMAAILQAPGEQLKAAIEAARKAGSMTYTFELKTRMPPGDPFEARGRGLALAPRTLLLEARGTGGYDRKLVATADGSLVWHPILSDWERGDTEDGRGFQNPHDLLAVLQSRCARAVSKGDTLTLRFEGADAVEALGTLKADARPMNPEGTWMELTARLTEGRLRSIRSTAHVNFTTAPDSFDTEAVVTIDAFDRDQTLGWKEENVEAALKRLKQVRSK